MSCASPPPQLTARGETPPPPPLTAHTLLLVCHCRNTVPTSPTEHIISEEWSLPAEVKLTLRRSQCGGAPDHHRFTIADYERKGARPHHTIVGLHHLGYDYICYDLCCKQCPLLLSACSLVMLLYNAMLFSRRL